MSDKKPCVRCSRAIDPYARICPYCNQDQSEPVPAAAPSQAAPAAAYVPPAERSWRRHIMMIAGGILLLIASFVVGALINSDAAPENAPKPVTETTGEAASPGTPKRSDLTLVPVNDPAAIEQPITSAPMPNPAEGVPTEYQRSDATAVSSVEYAALAQRAQQEKKAQRLVDPRTITGPAYAQGRRPPENRPAPLPPPMTSASDDDREAPEPPQRERPRVGSRTRPVPQDQPLPSIRVSEPVTVRLDLTIGPDGRVKAVHLRDTLPGQTPQLIAAVQRWRFKPATENGVPVSAPFRVDISFQP